MMIDKIFDEIVEMYVQWSTGADEKISMSDWLCRCFDCDIDPDEIEKAGGEYIKKHGLF